MRTLKRQSTRYSRILLILKFMSPLREHKSRAVLHFVTLVRPTALKRNKLGLGLLALPSDRSIIWEGLIFKKDLVDQAWPKRTISTHTRSSLAILIRHGHL